MSRYHYELNGGQINIFDRFDSWTRPVLIARDLALAELSVKVLNDKHAMESAMHDLQSGQPKDDPLREAWERYKAVSNQEWDLQADPQGDSLWSVFAMGFHSGKLQTYTELAKACMRLEEMETEER